MIDRIKIGPIVYKVKLVDDLSDECVRLNGFIKYDEARILIDRNLDPQKQRLTLWHEVMHGLASLVQLELNEQEVERLAGAMMSFVLDNPEL